MTGSKKILVVDNEIGIRYLLSDILSGEGFQVSLARDGQESLDKLEKCDFDLVITDIDMPRLDGIEMLKRMNQDRRNEKVIIMTGGSLEINLSDNYMDHVVTKLQKPVWVDDFLDVVSAAVDREIN
ncbi:MAG: response regulator [Desulfobacterales bacterium]|nr:response regulator [Desulfobacterales bacterium]